MPSPRMKYKEDNQNLMSRNQNTYRACKTESKSKRLSKENKNNENGYLWNFAFDFNQLSFNRENKQLFSKKTSLNKFARLATSHQTLSPRKVQYKLLKKALLEHDKKVEAEENEK